MRTLMTLPAVAATRVFHVTSNAHLEAIKTSLLHLALGLTVIDMAEITTGSELEDKLVELPWNRPVLLLHIDQAGVGVWFKLTHALARYHGIYATYTDGVIDRWETETEPAVAS